MRALGTPRDGERRPSSSRPFDATRDGFVCAEGATILVVETLERAIDRGAGVYAEVRLVGSSNDAYHVAAPHPEARGVIEMMRVALERAGLEPERVGYINAHGTSTPAGIPAETLRHPRGLRRRTPTAWRSHRRSRRRGTSSAAPAPSRRWSARWRCATA